MTVDIKQVESILKTLPIGYYCGRDYEVKLDSNIQTSMYNFSNETIYVAWNNIATALNSMPEVSYDKLEGVIRGLLYHELSHAILTILDDRVVSNLRNWGLPHEAFNIFEDERIETILKDYYHKVNFKHNLYLINGTELNIKSNIDKFFAIVRYRKEKNKWGRRIDKIIDDYKYLSSNSDHLNWVYYIREVALLYKDICDDDEQNEQNNNPTVSKSNSVVDVSEEFNSAMNDTEMTESGEKDAGLYKRIERVLRKNISEVDDYYDRLYPILEQAKIEAKRNSGAISAYSGRIDPRLVANNDYRYFKRENRLGSNATTGTHLHLNIFCDDSGSFSCNKVKVNSLFASLARLEKDIPKFSFTLIRCGSGIEVCDKKERYIEANQGTHFYCSDRETVQRLWASQPKNMTVFNILMYDGYCIDDRNYLRVFDTKNTTIIYEVGNIDNFRCFQNAKLIYTSHYTEEFIDRIIERLGFLTNTIA